VAGHQGRARETRREVTDVAGGNAVRSRDKRNERTGPVLFYRQVVAELRKVVWPTQQQLITYFLVVMVFVVFMMGLVSGLDVVFGKAIFSLFNGQSTN
jgi:preprotein translocase subunit SecE